MIFNAVGKARTWFWLLVCIPAVQAISGSAALAQDPAAAPRVTPPAATVAASPSPAVKATAARFTGDKLRTQITLELSGPIKPTIFVLGDPYRAIVDVSDLQFKFAGPSLPAAYGLVGAWRYGLFAARKSRMVFDVVGPVKVEQIVVTQRLGDQTWRLSFELVAIDAATFDAQQKAQPRTARPALKASTFDDLPAAAASMNLRPVVVIDPGHGGLDPGASNGGVLEKNIVLAVGRHLKALLTASGRYEVSMTRNSDVFVPLDQRLRTSQKMRADLFISIHADAVGEVALAQNVRGATIYTLSDQASDEQARLLAEKENAVDTLAGIDIARDKDGDAVRNILVDLLKRETSNFSHEFSAQLANELRRHVALARDPQRGAGFKVLKQTQTPSVLIELGYMSNVQDQKLLQSPDWQRQVATGIATAVDRFFDKRQSTSARQ